MRSCVTLVVSGSWEGGAWRVELSLFGGCRVRRGADGIVLRQLAWEGEGEGDGFCGEKVVDGWIDNRSQDKTGCATGMGRGLISLERMRLVELCISALVECRLGFWILAYRYTFCSYCVQNRLLFQWGY